MQVGPLLAYGLLREEPIAHWFAPVFVATTVFTFSAGLMQIWTAWRRAHPSVRRRAWFLGFALVSQLVYAEFKNVVARTAHIKQAMGEDTWTVTPRSTPSHQPDSATPAPHTTDEQTTRRFIPA
jgi:hypothetical protein